MRTISFTAACGCSEYQITVWPQSYHSWRCYPIVINSKHSRKTISILDFSKALQPSDIDNFTKRALLTRKTTRSLGSVPTGLEATPFENAQMHFCPDAQMPRACSSAPSESLSTRKPSWNSTARGLSRAGIATCWSSSIVSKPGNSRVPDC